MMMDYFLVFLVVMLTACGQVLQKLGAERGLKAARSHGERLRALFQREILLAVFCLATALALWLVVLYRMEVGRAFPLISSGFVVVLLAARFVLREQVPWWRWLGAGLIMAGVSLLVQAP